MIGAGLSALGSYWWRNPIQLVTLLVGLALATALWSGVQAINAEARSSYDAAASILGEGRYDQLQPRAGDTIAEENYFALRRAGWNVWPMVEGRFSAGEERIRLIGIDPLAAPQDIGSSRLFGRDAMIDPLGQRLFVAHPDVAQGLAEAVSGRVIADEGVAPGTALTDIGVAQELLGLPGALSRIMVGQTQPLGLPPLEEVAPVLIRQPAQDVSEVGQLTNSFHLNLTAFGFLSFAVGLFIVHGAVGLAFEQRRGMIRTLRALGMPLRGLIALMALELAVLALTAGVIGVLLGYALAAALLPDVAATLEGLYGAQVSGALHLRPEWWLAGLCIALAGAAMAASGAFWRIGRMPILSSAGAAQRGMATPRRLGLQLAVALVLLAAAGLLVPFGRGLVAGFACLACLLLGAAAALPVLLDGIVSGAQRLARTARWEWFWADTRLQLPGLSLALMALMLAMSANVGVSTMVASFRLTFVGFLDQRLASELYVQAESEEQARDLARFLDTRADAVLPLLSMDTRLAGREAQLFGARVGRTYEENWTFLASDDAVWSRVAEGRAVIINEQLARRSDLWVGDSLAVAPGKVLPIAGVFGDYGNPIGQAIIGEPLFRSLFPDIRATRFGIRSDAPAALRQALVEEFGLSEERITDQEALKAFSLRVFTRTFAVTGALNALTFAVAGFAMLMSLLTLAGMRLPHLAPVWALGLTRRELAALELLRTVILAFLTLILALPLGLALAWVLLAVVNVEAFGWRLPMFVFPADYAWLGLIALVAALLAALWPARKLARTPPTDLLKVFANER